MSGFFYNYMYVQMDCKISQQVFLDGIFVPSFKPEVISDMSLC